MSVPELQPVKREAFRGNMCRGHDARVVFLNNEFSSFVCKFLRNFPTKPNTMKILSVFQEIV